MITPMIRYDFLILSSSREAVMDSLSSLGVIDITRSEKAVDSRSEAMFAEIASLRERIKQIKSCTDAHLTELEASRDSYLADAAKLEPWGEFDYDKLSSLGRPVHFCCVPERKFCQEWASEYALAECSRVGGKLRFVVLGNSIPAGVTEELLPCRSLSRTRVLASETEKEAEAYRAVLESRLEEIPALEEKISALVSELGVYLAAASGEAAADNRLLVYTGFAPESERERLATAFDELPCVWQEAKATVEDNPPIKLKNNKFVKQFELLTDMYGRPDYNEFDPTPYISIFFLLFFAMCMGDAGYGLLLLIGGAIMRKAEGLAKFSPLVMLLGAGTFVVGIVMHTFFGVDIAALPWIPQALKSVMITGNIAGFEAPMVLSIVTGIFHLCLAMVVKTVYATRNRGFLGSLAVWGWTLLVVGGTVVGALAIFSILPPAVAKWLLIGLGVLSALGIFLFNDVKRNPLKNVGAGLWDTYNTVTGLLGDVLSYLRLYALGLAGGMLGKAFNDIASMTLGDGTSVFSWLVFILILVVGHALNLAMCCLGAFVHPLRLNFLEFFKNSGYDGKGRKYSPVTKL